MGKGLAAGLLVFFGVVAAAMLFNENRPGPAIDPAKQILDNLDKQFPPRAAFAWRKIDTKTLSLQPGAVSIFKPGLGQFRYHVHATYALNLLTPCGEQDSMLDTTIGCDLPGDNVITGALTIRDTRDTQQIPLQLVTSRLTKDEALTERAIAPNTVILEISEYLCISGPCPSLYGTSPATPKTPQ